MDSSHNTATITTHQLAVSSSSVMMVLLLKLIFFSLFYMDLSAQELSHSLIRNITTCPNLHKLVNISLSGSGYHLAPLGQRTTFNIHVEPVSTRLIGKSLDSILQARLHGTTILAAEIEPSLTNHSLFHVSYTLRDPGEYRLQLRMVWLSGANAEFSTGLFLSPLFCTPPSTHTLTCPRTHKIC